MSEDGKVLMRQETMGTRIISANRKTTWAGTVTLLVSFFVVVFSALAVIYSRPLMTVQSGGLALLATPTGQVVETGKVMTTTDLLDLAGKGPEAFERMETLVYGCGEELEGTCSERIKGYFYANASWTAIYGEDGTTALLSNGLKSIRGPSTGVVTFNGGLPKLVGKGYKEVAEPAATAACAANRCPAAQCIVGVVEEIARSVTCSGVKLWEWPTGVSLQVQPVPVDAPMLSGQFAGCVSQYDDCIRSGMGQPGFSATIGQCQNARDACVVAKMRASG